MSNSSLASYVGRVSSCGSRNGTLIDSIIIHIAKSSGDCSKLYNLMNSSNSSCNYGIANDGTVGLYVDEEYRAWSCGSSTVDARSVSIMVCNSSGGPNYGISSKAFDALIKLCTDICRRNFIFELKWTGKPAGSNLLMHSWYAQTDCPGPYLSSKYGEIARKVTTALKDVAKATSQTEALKSQSTIVVDRINSFVATIDPSATSGVDYRKLKIAGVVGCMFYAGGLFNNDVSHSVKSKYASPTLKSQISQCSNHMPYALYCDVRARNEKEAKLECEQLFYVISKYPPKLGIWMWLDLGNSVETNNKILEKYYQYFYKWGLHDKCGIYCTKSQLSKISWTNFSERMSLWIVDMQSNVSDCRKLQVPQFFKV